MLIYGSRSKVPSEGLKNRRAVSNDSGINFVTGMLVSP
jgi:hypothetical protein